MKKNKIFVISAADRYNFGDLLFNYIITFVLTKDILNLYDLVYTSLTGKDLTKYGGYKTISFRNAFKDISNGDVILFSGGGLLGHKWTPMFLQIFYNTLIRKIIKIIGKNFTENIIKKLIFRTNDDYPFTKSAYEFNKRVRIIYNAVGGGALNSINEKELSIIAKKLLSSTHLSVRDKYIYSILKKSIDEKEIELVPDNAILFSDIYSKEELLKKTQNSLQEYFISDYILMQFNYNIAVKYKKQINSLIDWLFVNINKKILLLPVNFINNMDRKGQRLFANNKKCKTIHFIPNIFEICTLISHSSLLLGTSLHANIIACSYLVPHLGLSKDVEKLNEFFKTWYDNDCTFNTYMVEEISSKTQATLDEKERILVFNTNMKKKVKENINKISSILRNSEYA